MRRFFRGGLCLLALSSAACAPKAGSELTVLVTEGVRDPSGAIELEMAYQNLGEASVLFAFKMRALGTEEMDKLVLDLKLDGLHLLEGNTEWSGFVPPRQPQTHRVSLVTAEGAERANVTVSVRRSVDSELLMQREFTFRVTPSGLEPVS